MDKVKEILEKQLQLLSEQEDVKLTHDMCEIAMTLYHVEAVRLKQIQLAEQGRLGRTSAQISSENLSG